MEYKDTMEAAELFELLQAGVKVSFNYHILEKDDSENPFWEPNSVCITNPYGLDHFINDLSLEVCEEICAHLNSGECYGMIPH